jgi:hypothetical protein
MTIESGRKAAIEGLSHPFEFTDFALKGWPNLIEFPDDERRFRV